MTEYYFVDVIKEDDGFRVAAKADTIITYQMYKEIKSWLNFAGFYQTCRSIKNMTLESADDLEKYLTSLQQITGGHTGLEVAKYLTTGNKLFIGFLSFIKTFIDVISKAISRKRQNYVEEFQKMNSAMYDMFFGYRFFTRMRNYVIHYDMPLTTIIDSVDAGISMRCGRENLLQFKKWNTLRNEIEQLPEQIDIIPYIAETKAAISALYLKALESVAPQVIEGNQKFVDLCKKRGLSAPIFLILDEDAEAPQIEQLPLHLVQEFFEDLNEHPNYNINLIPYK